MNRQNLPDMNTNNDKEDIMDEEEIELLNMSFEEMDKIANGEDNDKS